MRNKLTICLLLIVSFSMAQDYSFKRNLGKADSTWHEIPLDLSILSRLNKDLSDIRIFSKSNENDSIQVPYLIRKEKLNDTVKKNVLTRLSTTRIGDVYEIIFEASNSDYINSILLDFYDENYDWNVEVLGSYNRNDWQYLVRDYRILSIRDSRAHFAYNRIYFPRSKYRYYRVYIPTKQFPRVSSIHSRYSISAQNKLDSVRMSSIQKRENKKEKTTEIVINYGKQTPLAYLNFKFDDVLNYYRRATISYLSDSTKNVNGEWMYDYTPIAYTILNSINENEVYFTEHFVKQIKITIENEDNAPLKLKSVTGKHFKRKLIARFPEPGSYNLFYGNSNAERPKYDIAAFEYKIPQNITQLVPGKELTIHKKPIDQNNPIIENKWWLWAIMGVVILLLGLFTIKMIKAK